MVDWTSGYVADVGYTFGYYPELNPTRLAFPLVVSGIAPPKIRTACELGFGHGVSTNIHAAISDVEWWGTDFNPTQTAFARDFAEATGSGARLFDQSFAEFAARPDLPDFDFIALHGIWSWVSAENQAVIVDFVRRKLKVGGLLFISYNALPGFAQMIPMRHLMAEHAEIMAPRGIGTAARIDSALDFFERLMAVNPVFERDNGQIRSRLDFIKQQARPYLAHEYFNSVWRPIHFSEMAACLAPAKLNFACSANLHDLVENMNFTPEQMQFLREIPDPMFRESTRDFMVNQQFRRDYWIRGERRLTSAERMDHLRGMRFMLVNERAREDLSVANARGRFSLHTAIYHPILDLLQGHRTRSFHELEEALTPCGIAHPQLCEALVILTGKSDIAVLGTDEESEALLPRAIRFNDHVIAEAKRRNEVHFLACATTGGAISVDRIDLLFLASYRRGRRTAQEWADECWQTLKDQAQRPMQDGQVMENDAQSQAYLSDRAQTWEKFGLPAAKALKAVV